MFQSAKSRPSKMISMQASEILISGSLIEDIVTNDRFMAGSVINQLYQQLVSVFLSGTQLNSPSLEKGNRMPYVFDKTLLILELRMKCPFLILH